MASSKEKSRASKPDKAGPRVKEGRVTKPAQTPVAKSKELAKQAISKIKLKDEKTKKSKKVKEPSPEPESESESDSGSEEGSEDDSGSSISDSDSDVSDSEMKNTGIGNAKANGVPKAAADDSDSEVDSEEDEPVKAAPAGTKVNGTSVPKAAANKKESDSESDSGDGSDDASSDAESEDDSVPAAKRTASAQQDDDTSDESESSEDEAAPSKANGVKVNGAAKKDDGSSSEVDEDGDSGSDVSSSDESEEEVEAPSKKRKAEEPVTPAAKKSKGFESADATPASRNLFVGNLSWNVDEEWLAREFEEFGELVGCRLITDRESGRSKGYGYVEFADPETAAKAHAEKNGAMIDGRELRVDFSQGRTPKTNENTPQRAQRFGDTVGKPADTLFCGNLSFDCTNDMLSDAFSEFGTITRVSLPRDRESDLPKGFGYVAFSTVEEAKAAFEAMQGTQLAGRPMRLDYAGPRPDNGGAGGGRGGGRGGRGGFGNRGGRGGFGDRGGRGGRGGARGGRGGSFGSTNRGGFGDFKGKKVTF